VLATYATKSYEISALRETPPSLWRVPPKWDGSFYEANWFEKAVCQFDSRTPASVDGPQQTSCEGLANPKPCPGKQRKQYPLLPVRFPGLEVKHLSSDCKTITVEQSCWEGDIQTPKTKNALHG
jgi:hypothetical protein